MWSSRYRKQLELIKRSDQPFLTVYIIEPCELYLIETRVSRQCAGIGDCRVP